MELQRNSQVYEIGYHIIFCTKYRHKVLVGEVETTCRNSIAETRLFAYDGSSEPEIMPDHVHMFVSAPPQTAPAEIARTVKSISATRFSPPTPSSKEENSGEAASGPHQPTSARSDTYPRTPPDDTSKRRRNADRRLLPAHKRRGIPSNLEAGIAVTFDASKRKRNLTDFIVLPERMLSSLSRALFVLLETA